MRRWRFGGSIYQRFYLSTLLTCFASLAVFFFIARSSETREWQKHLRRLGQFLSAYAADELAPYLGDPPTAQHRLEEMAQRLEAKLTLLDAHGRPIATTDPALPLPSSSDLELVRGQGYVFSAAKDVPHWLLVPLHRPDQPVLGYLQGSFARHPLPPSVWRNAGALAALLALVTLLMIPTTRSVTGPLERLTESARRFGEGNFQHRVPASRIQEIARLGEALNEMAERLATLLHTQKQLVADVSHELRSPLARIGVALELARSQAENNPAVEQQLQFIGEDVTELSRLVDDCLAASRLELRPDLVRMDETSATELLEMARRRALAAGLPEGRISLELAPHLPDVRADTELCSHALLNLIDNARRHTPEGTPIALGARLKDDRILLYVRDQGPGIATEEQARLFEPFYRPDSSRSRQQGGGTGLGLSLVRRIAELHGAPPWLQSVQGVGSTFGLTLPRA